MILREEHNENFVVITYDMLRDNTLSLKAKGLLSLMLSYTDDYKFHISQLATVCKETRQAITRIMDELIEQGYVAKAPNDYIVTEFPVTKRNIPVLQNVTTDEYSNVTKCNKKMLQNVTLRNNKEITKEKYIKRKGKLVLSDIDERDNDYDFIMAQLPDPLSGIEN